MTKEEAKKILEEVKTMDDSMYQYNKAYLDALNMAIKALDQEPVYFPPCVDCQDRSKEILTAYNNMKKMQAYTKEEVITMLDKIRAEIDAARFIDKDTKHCKNANASGLEIALQIINKYMTENEVEDT